MNKFAQQALALVVVIVLLALRLWLKGPTLTKHTGSHSLLHDHDHSRNGLSVSEYDTRAIEEHLNAELEARHRQHSHQHRHWRRHRHDVEQDVKDLEQLMSETDSKEQARRHAWMEALPKDVRENLVAREEAVDKLSGGGKRGFTMGEPGLTIDRLNRESAKKFYDWPADKYALRCWLYTLRAKSDVNAESSDLAVQAVLSKALDKQPSMQEIEMMSDPGGWRRAAKMKRSFLQQLLDDSLLRDLFKSSVADEVTVKLLDSLWKTAAEKHPDKRAKLFAEHIMGTAKPHQQQHHQQKQQSVQQHVPDVIEGDEIK
eukprot:TRINITY_DN7351_c0_g1_i1.p2 TRINITY_DN7351_c0_g1~~TRINITY_DN7351_c0_g1_i1.p2  ORF type:complete len:315 (-),score=162.09 TRINITY_DN7351_c0_g1_i1:53-997(-)